GPTTISKGFLAPGPSGLPVGSAILISGSGGLILGNSFASTNSISNSGGIYVSNGTFTVPSSFTTATGSLYFYLGGTLSGNITSGKAFSVGIDNNNTQFPTTFSNTNTITVNNVNIYNGSTLSNSGSGSINALS